MSQTKTRLLHLSPRLRYVTVLLAAGAAYAAFIVAGYPLVGVGAWVVLCGSGFGYRYLSKYSLFDERDQQLKGIAARQTIGAVGLGAAVLFPAAVVLQAIGYIEWSPWLSWLGIYTAGLGLLYTGLRVRLHNGQ